MSSFLSSVQIHQAVVWKLYTGLLKESQMLIALLQIHLMTFILTIELCDHDVTMYRGLCEHDVPVYRELCDHDVPV